MTIATLDAYKYALNNQNQIVNVNVGVITITAARLHDLWRAMIPVGAVPTASVAVSNATLGSLKQINPTTGNLAIVGMRGNSGGPGVYIIYDRLNHSGGLDATLTGARTVNLPTAALTRSTSGEGVQIGLTIYTQIGGIVTTVTASYTNTSDTAGRTTTAIIMGGTANREANRLLLLPLQAGDTGVKSVQSVSLVASTLTAGNFGVTLLKPVYVLISNDATGVINSAGFISGLISGGIPNIEDNACLFLGYMGPITGAGSVPLSGALLVSEH